MTREREVTSDLHAVLNECEHILAPELVHVLRRGIDILDMSARVYRMQAQAFEKKLKDTR